MPDRRSYFDTIALGTLLALACLAIVCAAPVVADESESDLPRVASTTICADQFLLALAAPTQISSLSHNAMNAEISLFAEQASQFATNRARAEELLGLEIDIVVMDTWGEKPLEALLKRFGVHVVRIPFATSFDTISDATLYVANEIGRSVAGKDLVDNMYEKVSQVRAASKTDTRRRGLYLLPTGSTASSGTYIDEVMEAAGLHNMTRDLGIDGWGRVSLETIVRDPPDVFVLGFFDRTSRTMWAGIAKHHLFQKLLHDRTQVWVPNAYWICAGPWVADATQYIHRSLTSD